MTTPTCKVRSTCPKGYTREVLVQTAARCDVSVKRAPPLRGNKSMQELCKDLAEKHGVDDACGDNNTTETLGMTVEYIICRLTNTPHTISDTRISPVLAKDEKLIAVVQACIDRLPRVVMHVGSENKATDFVLEGNKTLSVKTNFTGTKVCPQTIGQATRQKFMQYFTPGPSTRATTREVVTPHDIKSYVLDNSGRVVGEYFKHTFTCDFMLWIQKKKGNYTGAVIDRKSVLTRVLDNRKYSFSRSLPTWNESSSVRYNGKTIGEFQVHTNRNAVKFRFNMDNLLDVFQNDPSVFVISDKQIVHNAKSDPARRVTTTNAVARTLKSR